jgi:LPS export ABC transporter protein LptC
VRWQRPARVATAVVGLGCALALAMYGRDRKRPAAQDAPPVLTDEKVSTRGKGVLNLRTDFTRGKEELRIEAETETTYTDGHTRLDRAHFTSLRRDGTTFQIWADTAESQGKAVTGDEPGLIHLTGHVRTTSSDGLEVKTDEATYNNVQGLATIPGPLTFTRGRLSGEGVGGTYDRERDLLWLFGEAHVTRVPDADGGGAIEARAKEIGVARPEKYMNLREHATIAQADQTLSADQIMVHFNDDDRGARLIEMHGHARVTPRADAASGAPDMQASEMTLEFQPDGQTLRHATLTERARVTQTTEQGTQTISAAAIDLVTAADGRTLTNLDAKGTVEVLLPASGANPDRTIHSTTLVTSGEGQAGLKSAVFAGGVTFVEKLAARPARGDGRAAAAVDRTGTSDSLALDLKGQLGAIQTAEFRKNVSFTDGALKAGADLAVHDETRGTLVLTPAAGAKRPPWVDDGSVHVEALWIQVAMDTHDLQARTSVKARMTQRPAEGESLRTAALFDSTQPVYGTGASLQYMSASHEATFAGEGAAPARVYQSDGQNWISATERITVEQETGNLHAVGAVVSNFVFDSAGDDDRGSSPGAGRRGRAAGSAPKAATTPETGPTVANAHEMTYVDADRRAVYAGDESAPARLRGPDLDVSAREIVLTLVKDQRALKTLEATGSMAATFEGGRETMGDKLVYDAVSKTHVMTGKPMYFKNVQNDSGKTSCSLEKSTELHYNGKDQTIDEPASDAKALRPSEAVACDKPLKALVK